MAFSNLAAAESFEPITVAIVEKKEDVNFTDVMKELSENEENKIFNIQYLGEEEAKKELADGKIEGIISIDEEITLQISTNGTEQTIIKYVLDSYKQTMKTIESIAAANPEAIAGGILSNLNEDTNYTKDNSNQNVDHTVVYFYTLIGMVCMNGGFFGIKTVNETEANISEKGARLAVAPVHKLKVLLCSLLVAFIIQYVEALLVLAYLCFVLGVNFGSQMLFILLLTFMGVLAGISLGTFVGACSRKGEEPKANILIAVTMTCSFLSGMMILEMKYWILKYVPVFAYLNPVSLITDGLYALYYYATHERFFTNMIALACFIVIINIFSYLFIRRKKYDSI